MYILQITTSLIELETLTDFKFVDVKAKAHQGSKSMQAINAGDRCPQLDAVSSDRLFAPLMYHVRTTYAADFPEAWITDAQFQSLVNVDKIKFCLALNRQTMVRGLFLFYVCMGLNL